MKTRPAQLLMVMASVFLGVAAFGVIYAALQPGWYRNIKAEITSQPYARTVTVSAEGTIYSKPDIALISLSVVSKGKTVKAVTQDGNNKMNAVIDTVKTLGVEPKDITSTDYSLYPEYFYPENKPPYLIGYQLRQQIQVKIRELELVEDVLDAGVNAGANQVGQLSFDIDDPTQIKKEAREKAFEAAKEKAKEMAKAAGVKLGRVVTFSESDGYYPPVFANYMMEAKVMADSESASIEPGSKKMNLTVSVTYEIE